MTQETPAYIPGVCNINRAEIAQRRQLGYYGAIAFIVILVILLAFSLDRWFRLILFFPAALATTGFLQARNKFCVGYAAAGQQNADEDSPLQKAQAVAAEADHKKDKARARQLNLQTTAIALVVAAICVALPQ